MIALPRDVTKGQAVRADDFNKLLAAVRSLRLSGSSPVRVSSNTQGTVISLGDLGIPDVSGGSVTIIHPFQITDASDGTGASVNIRFGKLNNLTPTLADGTTYLVDALTNIALSPSATTGTWVVFMAVAIVHDNTILVPVINYVYVVAQKGWTEAGDGGDPTLLGYQIIAEVDVVAGVGSVPDKVSEIRQVVTHSLRHQICGRQLADSGASPPISFDAGYPTFWGV